MPRFRFGTGVLCALALSCAPLQVHSLLLRSASMQTSPSFLAGVLDKARNTPFRTQNQRGGDTPPVRTGRASSSACAQLAENSRMADEK